MYLALGHFQRLFYCVYSHRFTSAFQFPDIFHDVCFNKFWVKPLFSIIFCHKWHCLDESWSLSETTPWDFLGFLRCNPRHAQSEASPEVESFSFFPNSSQKSRGCTVPAPCEEGSGWDKRAATRSWRSQNLWIQFLPTLLRQINKNEREEHLHTHTEAHATCGREQEWGLHCQKGALSATSLQKSNF